ncbi:MAG: transposase [Geminicoccaceae bacterium]
MARKRRSDEDILKLLREIELALAFGKDVATACRTAGISDATYYSWRRSRQQPSAVSCPSSTSSASPT